MRAQDNRPRIRGGAPPTARYGAPVSSRARVAVIDNYDSFVFNLVQYLGELGAQPVVHRHDALALDQIVALEPDAVLVSPGPGTPDDAGISNDVIRAFTGSGPDRKSTRLNSSHL